MKLRRSLPSLVAAAALLLPSAASASHVHIAIGFSHVERDGKTKLKISGELHGTSCTANRHLKIQRRKDGDWNTIAHDSSNQNGSFSTVVRDRTGRYRVVAPATSSCHRESGIARHSH